MLALGFLGLGGGIPTHFLKKKALNNIQEKLGHRFKRPALLGEALSHRSYTQTNPKAPFPSYERLEFLGDSVLGMVMAEVLFRQYHLMGEGDLTKTKAVLVNVHTLARIAREIGISRFVKISEEEEKAGGRDRNSILADCLEAIIGAIYLDSGIRAARTFVQTHFLKNMADILSDQSLRNFKGELLELVQANSDLAPHYEILRTEGPDHLKKFTVGVYLGSRRIGTGHGLNKKEAEQHAARKALEKLHKSKKNSMDCLDKVEEK